MRPTRPIQARPALAARRRHPGGLPARIAVLGFMAALLATSGARPALAAPVLTLVPNAGPVGTSVTATGSGFSDGPYVLCWDGSIPLTYVSAAGGAFKASFTVPLGKNVVHVVGAVPGSQCALDPVATADFTIGPAPTRTPRPVATPTPKPSSSSPPAPTPTASGAPASAAPSPTGGLVSPPTPLPTFVGPGLPVPSFPISGGPTPVPTPYPALIASLKPQPPDGLTASPGPFPDLDVLAIEVTQGIQDLNNNMPLVADRRTYVRVYLDVIGQNELAHTYGALEARRSGQQIGWIWPENGPITAIANGGNRLDLDDSLYFRLPSSWLHGEVTLTAFVYSHDVTFPWTKEPEWQNNFESEVIDFHEAELLDVHLVTIHLHRSFHPTDVVREYAPSAGAGDQFATEGALDFSRILAGFFRYHPIADLAWDVFPLSVYPPAHGSGDEWDLGVCHTEVAEPDPDYPGLLLADWHPLMAEDSDEPAENASTVPDRDSVYILDRKYTVDHFYIREGGRAQIFASSDGVGPDPIVGAPAFVGGCPNPGDESGEPNTTVSLFRILYDWADAREFFVSMVDPSLPTKWGGLASTLDTAWVKMNPNVGDASWYYAGSATIAHETAHLTGLDHVACKDSDHDGIADEIAGGPVDPTHPQQLRFPMCSLAEVRDYGYYGFDVYWDSYGLPGPSVVSNDPAAPVENRAWPMLSYRSPRWIDPYHYCRLLQYYGVPCDADSIDEPWVPPGGDNPDGLWLPTGHGDPPPDPGVPILLLSGHVDRDGDGTTIAGLLSLVDPPESLLQELALQDLVPPDGRIGRLVGRDADGAVVREVPIPVEPLDDDVHGFGTADPLPYDLLMPLDPSIVSIEVEVEGETKASLPVSSSAPVARWTSLQPGAAGEIPALDADTTVTYEASDADGDALTATLLYSPDGEHWTTVVARSTDSTIPVGAAIGALPGSDRGALRLLVSDGVHTTVATDEPTVRVADKPPIVHIDAPTLLMTVPLGHEVTLQGSAFDREDRTLPDEAFSWASSIDGPIGTGREVRTRDLSAGRHTLTMSAVDSHGAAATTSIELIVDGSLVEPGPAAELASAVDGLFAQLGAGEDPTAPSSAAEPDLALVAAIAGVLAALALALGLVALQRRRRRDAPLG